MIFANNSVNYNIEHNIYVFFLLFTFRKSYKYQSKKRVFPATATSAASSSGLVSSAKEGSKPLAGMKFLIAGKTTKSKADLTQAVTKLGGSVVSKVDKKVSAVISTKGKNNSS